MAERQRRQPAKLFIVGSSPTRYSMHKSRWLFVVGFTLGLLDVATTAFVVTKWGIGHEANPLMRTSMESIGLTFTFLWKMLTTVLILSFMSAGVEKKLPFVSDESAQQLVTTFYFWYTIVIAYGVFLVVNNMQVIEQLGRLA